MVPDYTLLDNVIDREASSLLFAVGDTVYERERETNVYPADGELHPEAQSLY